MNETLYKYSGLISPFETESNSSGINNNRVNINNMIISSKTSVESGDNSIDNYILKNGIEEENLYSDNS